MHLDTVLTFADYDCVTVYPDIVDNIVPFTLRAVGRTARIDASSRRTSRSWRWPPMPSAFRSCG